MSVALLALGAAMVPSTAHASWMNVTSCEQITIDNHDYGLITFDIVNSATGIGLGPQVMEVFIRPYGRAPGDTCDFSVTALPTGWAEHEAGIPDGWHWWVATAPQYAVGRGETLTGIQIRVAPGTCCFSFGFPDPIGENTASYPVCFACPGTTPAAESSWGRVKQTYR